MSKTKILISTDSAKIHTGLAETCRMVFTRLLEKYPDQYDIHQLGWFNFNTVEEVAWPVYSTHVNHKGNGQVELDHNDRYGQKTFEGIRAKVKPDIVWTNGDLWCFEHLLQSPARNTFRLLSYYTIDGEPYWGSWIKPGEASEWGAKLVKSDRLVVLTEFGEKVLHKSCPELHDKPIDVIYHPMDPGRFSVLPREQKIIKRDSLYTPQIPRDAFMLGWIGRNQFRKQNHKMWEVLHYIVHGDYIVCKDCNRVTHMEYDLSARCSRDSASLTKYDPGYAYDHCWHCKSDNVVNGTPIDDLYLWMHMVKNDPGWNCDLFSTLWDVEHRITYTAGLQASKGLHPKVLADLISTWDASLYLSGGEGFGIPAFESLMSGVPVIYTNYSSHADFCKHGGLPVRVDYQPELNFSIHRAVANTDHAIEQILWAYQNRESLHELGLKGRAFTETKNLDSVVDRWHQIFQEMMKEPLPANNPDRVYCETI